METYCTILHNISHQFILVSHHPTWFAKRRKMEICSARSLRKCQNLSQQLIMNVNPGLINFVGWIIQYKKNALVILIPNFDSYFDPHSWTCRWKWLADRAGMTVDTVVCNHRCWANPCWGFRHIWTDTRQESLWELMTFSTLSELNFDLQLIVRPTCLKCKLNRRFGHGPAQFWFARRFPRGHG